MSTEQMAAGKLLPQAEHGGRETTNTIHPEAERLGEVIGPYRLFMLIGRGGMGEVWLAEQESPIRRRVAIKLIKAGMDTNEVVARFESERQALALMDHPAIAKVFAAGTTMAGRPYFVMEYVVGIPITLYCNRHQLTIRNRLAVLVNVCEGVQHAHQKAIMHRDLKPSNILVAEVDRKPMPKIIDFGVAKATSQHLTAKTIFTSLGAFLGTPEYASPEQANPSGEDVDTRTDVYSLGVILYELLVGALPLDFHNLTLDEMRHKLREEEPRRPSATLRALGDQSHIAAKERATDLRTLAGQIRGDLDAIAMKALEKDRSRRYASPSEFATDIGRYLRHEPISARPASKRYRARKYIRRHRFGVAAGATALLLVLSFVMAQWFQLRRITSERDRANRITDFMTRMFKISDPNETHGNNVTAREILDNASRGIEAELARDPKIQAQMMDVMGTVYENLGLYPRAHTLLQGAADIRLKVLGPRDPETLSSRAHLANVLHDEGRYAEAEKLQRETLEIRRRVLGPEHPDTLQSSNDLANALDDEGRYDDAEKLHRETLEIRRRVLGPEHLDTAASMNNLANLLEEENRYAEAEKLQRETLEIRRRLLGPEHLRTLASMNNLANILDDEGHYVEAEKLQREMMSTERRILGPEHPETLASIDNLAGILSHEGRNVEAERLQREITGIERRILGPEHPVTLASIGNLATTLFSQGHYAESEKLQREALYGERTVLGSEHLETVRSIEALALTLKQEGHLGEAERLAREALGVRRRVLGSDRPDTADSVYLLGAIAARQGRRDETVALLREAIDHGLSPTRMLAMEQDTDLKSLVGDPRFTALVSYAHRLADKTQKTK